MVSARTITLYLCRHYLLWLAIVFAVFSLIVALFDIIELLRRASGKENIGFALVLKMAALKLPVLVQEITPFIILLGSMIAFWRLARVNELVVARASGMSPWQLIGPALCIAVLVGIGQVAFVNPFAATLNAQFEEIETEFLRKKTNQLALGKSGFWLREIGETEYLILHAGRVDGESLELSDVMALRLDKSDRVLERIDAEAAALESGFWELSAVRTLGLGGQTAIIDQYRLRTAMTKADVRESFASAEAVSFWELPRFIEQLENAGFSAIEHRLRFHSLLATPLLFFAMVLVGAVFSLRTSQRRSAAFLILGGVICGFTFFFVTQVVHALGLSTGVPIVLAAWIPAGVMTMLGLTALLHLEDG
ncbi:MAG: LPS export ABC transporter permease LptG [Alphaproteobacteria bacterium]|nr:LPS export ABC transporter permease LptG [Alphaproteobacteria bacterium]